MTANFQITFDAHHPAALAKFWALALGYIVQPPPDGFSTWEDFAIAHDIPEENRGEYGAIVDPEGIQPRVLFIKVPEGKVAKNRVHLDVAVDPGDGDRRDAVRARVAALVAAGASYVQTFDRKDEFWVVCTDPEGNEFCVM